MLDATQLKRHPLPPVEEGDKNSNGQLLLIAGSRETPGSALIGATAAFRSGCGKVPVATVEPMAPHVGMKACGDAGAALADGAATAAWRGRR